MKALFLAVCAFFLVSCASMPKQRTLSADGKIYQTYLVNESPHYAEYRIENLDIGVDMYSGVLPPRWAVKNQMDNWKKFDRASGKLPWVLKVEIHEELLGTYKIHIRFLYTREGAQTDGKWRSMVTYLTKEDFERADGLFPYWEIIDDPKP